MTTRALVLLGMILQAAPARAQNADAALELCEGGDRAACAKAEKLLRAGCDKSNAAACNNLGYMYRQALVRAPEPAAIVALFQRACTLGDMQGCLSHGVALKVGRGVPVNMAGAIASFRKGCDGGAAGACYNLGLAYQNGQGVVEDHGQALLLYERSCELGDGSGCFDASILNLRGDGTKKDPARAFALAHRACDLRDADGCTRLGVNYHRGEWVGKDPERALALFRRGCEMGDAEGCHNVAGVLDDPKDPAAGEQAARYLGKACDGKFALSCEALRRLCQRKVQSACDRAPPETPGR